MVTNCSRPHVALVPFTGFRVRAAEMLALGMKLPGLQKRGAALAELPALGLLTLAGMNPEHWTASYHPSATAGDTLLSQVLATKPSLVALSALTASVAEAYCFSEQVREHGIPTVIGGLHVTACPDEAQQYCDAVVVGEGENSWRQVLADAEVGDLQSVYRSAPRVDHPRWPMPRFDLLGQQPPRFTLQTQRGCPLACEFCAASRLLGRFQEKPSANIDRELSTIAAAMPRPMLELADDNTFAGERDFSAFFAALRSSGARWFTESDWRLGERPELLLQLAAAGCVQVLVGIESLVFRYPGQGQKHTELQRIMRALAAIQEAGVVVNGCFIVGAEGETRDSLQRLVDFILASPLAEVQITLQTPFPGTKLHERLREQGRLLPDRSWSHYTLFDVTYEPDMLSVGELEQGFRNVLAAVYGPRATHRRNELRKQVWKNHRRLRQWAS
jgi:radical SAM superfamily enzyme YgiQ (UPF0313 family)